MAKAKIHIMHFYVGGGTVVKTYCGQYVEREQSRVDHERRQANCKSCKKIRSKR